MCPEQRRNRETGHIKAVYVPGVEKKLRNRSHKRGLCARCREETGKLVT
jgi:hypothetical protein